MKRLGPILLILVLAAGCGDQSTTDPGDVLTPEGNAKSSGNDVSSLYRNTMETAETICEDAGPKGIARDFGGNASDWEDLADRYSQGSTGDHIEYAKLGCLQGFAKR